MMKLYHRKGGGLTHVRTVPFKLERDIQQLVEENLEELFGLELVKSELSIGGFRFDTLCYDAENNAFVIIEYKKGSSYSVIDQGYSYLSTMLNNKSDFILEYNETKHQTLRRDEIDWSQSRIIFVSPKFSDYQKNAINFKNVPFELWEIKRYEGDLIALSKHQTNSTESIDMVSPGQPDERVETVSREVTVFTEEALLERTSEELRELYFLLKEKLLEWEGVECQHKKNYASFSYGNRKFLFVNVTRKHLRLQLYKKDFVLDDPHTPFQEIDYKSKIMYDYRMTDDSRLDRCLVSIKEKYESVKK